MLDGNTGLLHQGQRLIAARCGISSLAKGGIGLIHITGSESFDSALVCHRSLVGLVGLPGLVSPPAQCTDQRDRTDTGTDRQPGTRKTLITFGAKLLFDLFEDINQDSRPKSR